MKRALAGLALGMLLSSAAFADTEIDTAAFTITYIDGPTPPDWSISLVASSPGTYSFSLDSLNTALAGEWARDLTGAGATVTANYWSNFHLDIHAGYAVTGASISGIAFGELAPGQLPDFPPGIVSNFASMSGGVFDGTTFRAFGNTFDNFQAEQPLDDGTTGFALQGTTEIGMGGFVMAQAWGVEGGGAFAESSALASLRDVTLHIQVSAVPEPGMWAMLLAGIVLLAGKVQARRFQ